MDTTFGRLAFRRAPRHRARAACSLLLDFLRRTHCDTLYLVGDIIDLESLRRSFFWPTSHTEVLRVLLEEEPGRHARRLYPRQSRRRHARADRHALRQHRGARPLHSHDRAGRRLLVLHGDEFDAVIQHGFLVGGRRRRCVPRPACA